MKILAVFDQFGTERLHSSILLAAVAEGHHHDCAQAEMPGGKGLRLAVIAARRRNYTLSFRVCTSEPVHVHDSAPNLERAHWRVVLVFQPHFTARTPVEQRPGILRRGRNKTVDKFSSRL